MKFNSITLDFSINEIDLSIKISSNKEVEIYCPTTKNYYYCTTHDVVASDPDYQYSSFCSSLDISMSFNCFLSLRRYIAASSALL